jgi:tRNA dimethylallyltransferase
MRKPQIFVITGPTAVGKTAATVRFAQERGISVVSFDSRQFYKETNIGTAKPSPEEMQDVPHFFIHSHSIEQPLTAATFEAEAIPLINELIEKQGSVVLTGGSGMYLDALLKGIEPKPHIPEHITAELLRTLESKGLEPLVEELTKFDPDYAGKADLKNARRVLRALEIIRSTGQTYSAYRTGAVADRPWEAMIYILNRERSELYDRINKRVDLMMEAGLEDEARSLLAYRESPVMQTVGYQEFFPYFEGEYDLNRTIDLIKRNSRRYAKRQITWFKRYTDAVEIAPDALV